MTGIKLEKDSTGSTIGKHLWGWLPSSLSLRLHNDLCTGVKSTYTFAFLPLQHAPGHLLHHLDVPTIFAFCAPNRLQIPVFYGLMAAVKYSISLNCC